MNVTTLLFLSLFSLVNALNNGLALRPPMGWLSWERFRCEIDCNKYPDTCISENLFLNMAKKMAEDGYKDAGYEYVIIDDCWLASTRDPVTGRLRPDPTRFPHGIKWLADQIHTMGLKIGIYEDVGNETCGGWPGSAHHYVLDAQTFASWGIDYTKFDGCNIDASQYATVYPEVGKALNHTKRPIVYSCSWPAYVGIDSPWAEIVKNCNLWRLWGDIQDSWDSMIGIVNYWGTNQDVLKKNSMPGAWNDPDMIIVGDFSLSASESELQFGMWAMFAAPLIMSNDLRSLPDYAKPILLNREVILIDQDPLGIMATMLFNSHQIQIWKKPLANGDVAIAIINQRVDGIPFTVFASWSDLCLEGRWNVRDLFQKRDLGIHDDSISVDVDPHGIRLLRLAKQ
eukprot:TRINITY_DN2146_c0_g1_i1.p1 TRINITY_DN2146_c0_g1~~TRINITY_DN2146_c0_g1_i1.p1  ORF type:complete len:398 (-),score=63.75 TRINITY_DN2146_c0_g1_i1:39-1232(-)